MEQKSDIYLLKTDRAAIAKKLGCVRSYVTDTLKQQSEHPEKSLTGLQLEILLEVKRLSEQNKVNQSLINS
ncbi:MAG: hypothetical protein WC389_10060 [Lutibacter sp.]|jgi:hypothetical protein